MFHRSPFSRPSTRSPCAISHENRSGRCCGSRKLKGGAHQNAESHFDANRLDQLCTELIQLSYTHNAHPTDEHGIFFPTMVVHDTIQRFVGNNPEFLKTLQNKQLNRNDRLLFLHDEIILKILDKLQTFKDEYLDPGESSCEYITPAYDVADDRRKFFPDGFVNAQNRDLYTQLFVLQHWNSQTNHGTRTMGEIELVDGLADVDKKALVGDDTKLATFDEYRRLIVSFALRGAVYASETNKREHTGMLYDVYWAIDAYGI
jgi:hypothetical protein